MDERILESIKKSDKILIGIGESFQEKYESLRTEEFLILEKENPLEAGFRKLQFLKEHSNDDVIRAYKSLFELIKDKDYYIISTCTDDKIFNVDFDKTKIVTPCGGFRFLQCKENCMKELLPVSDEMIKNKS